MNEQVKFIVEKLNRDPFKKNLTFLNFDGLQGNNLLQLLNDVFTVLDSKQKADIRNEGADQTAIRMLNFLRVLKYKPPDENAQNFRQGLVTGDKTIVYPILKWCLEKLGELKKRAYLANYLVKINVPGEFMGDGQIIELYSHYESLIEQFKETHKTYDSLTVTQSTTEDLKETIEHMEKEKENLSKRLETLKKKVQRLNNTNSMLELSHNYRKEADRERKIIQQKADLHHLNVQLDQKIDKLERTLREQQNSFHDLNAETVIQKMEEENQVNSFMVNQKYPKELNMFKQKLKDYESILSKSAVTQSDITEFKKKIEDINQENRSLVERRDLSSDKGDDKLTLFRKQAHLIASKKEACAETLNELRSEYANYEIQLKEKKISKGLGDGDGEMLRGEDLKRYVNKLRSKGTTYKMKKQQITELQAEFTTLKRTEEIIRKKFESIKGQLSPEELQSFDKKNQNKSGDDGLSKKELKEKITKKKAELAPFVKELKALREICEEISGEYEAKKSKYDQINAGYEGNRSALEQDVSALLNEYRMSEERYHKLNSQKLISLAFQKRALDEIKMYTSKTTNDKSFREQLNKRLNEAEALSKNLKDRQKSVKDVSIDGTKQTKLWKDLLRQMELKRKISMGLPLDEMSAYNNAEIDFNS